MSNYAKIISMMQSASDHIQYPKFHLRHGYKLQLTGLNAKFPRSINITNGKGYHDKENIYYGRIGTNGILSMPLTMQNVEQDLIVELDLFQLNPDKYAKGFGELSGNCMFCRKPLHLPQSVALGYGATCAKNYGLRYGHIDPEIAKKQASFEFPIEQKKPDCKCDEIPPLMSAPTKSALDNLTILHNLPTDVFSDSIACQNAIIKSLKQIAIHRISHVKYKTMEYLIKSNGDDFETQYALWVTALWENL